MSLSQEKTRQQIHHLREKGAYLGVLMSSCLFLYCRPLNRDGRFSHPPGSSARPPLLGTLHLIATPHYGLFKGERSVGSHVCRDLLGHISDVLSNLLPSIRYAIARPILLNCCAQPLKAAKKKKKILLGYMHPTTYYHYIQYILYSIDYIPPHLHVLDLGATACRATPRNK